MQENVMITLYRRSGNMVEAFRDGEWKQVSTPDTSNIQSAQDYYNLLDFSSPGAFVDSYIEMVDVGYYRFMSQTELTENFYKMNSWIFEKFSNGAVDVLDAIVQIPRFFGA